MYFHIFCFVSFNMYLCYNFILVLCYKHKTTNMQDIMDMLQKFGQEDNFKNTPLQSAEIVKYNGINTNFVG